MSTPRYEWQLVHPEKAVEPVYRHLAMCAKSCEECRASKLVKEGEALAAAADRCSRFMQKFVGSKPSSVPVATCIIRTGAIPALAKVVNNIQELLQQPQQLSKEELSQLVKLGTSVAAVLDATAATWPQNVVLAKAFEPVLCPWISLVATLLTVLGYQEDSPVSGQLESNILGSLAVEAHQISLIVATSPGTASAGLIPPNEAARQLFLSDDLQKVLNFLLSVIAHAEYNRHKGVSPMLTYPSSCTSCSSSSSGQQHQGGLQVPPYHERLLRDLGLQRWKVPHDLMRTLKKETSLKPASVALCLTSAYRCQHGAGSPPLVLTIEYQLPHINEDGTASPTPALHPVQAAADSRTAAGSSSKSSSSSEQKLLLSLMLVMIECIAFDGDLVCLLDFMQPLPHNLKRLAVPDGSGGVVLEAEVASELLHAVVQVLAPAILRQMRATAATNANKRKILLQGLHMMLVPLVTQAPAKDLADCFRRSPLAAVVALDAGLRAYAVHLSTEVPGAAGPSAQQAKACGVLSYSYQVVQALHSSFCSASSSAIGCSNGSSSSSSPMANADLLQHSMRLIQLLLSCGKGVAKASALCSDLSKDDCAAVHYPMMLQLLCSLSNTVAKSTSKAAAGRLGSSAGSSSSSSGSSSSPQPEAMLWSVLIARNLMSLAKAATKACNLANSGISFGTMHSTPYTGAHQVLMWQQLPLTAGEAMAELGDQLTAISKLSAQTPPAIPAVDCESNGSVPPTRGLTAGQHAIAKLLVQQQETQKALQDYFTASAGDEHSKAFHHTAAGLPASGSGTTYSSTVGLSWYSLRQQLDDFCVAVCAALPLSSCCNNPTCLNLSKLSEQQLVGGKGCVCAGCAVARYCSQECQRQHWKQHKPACKAIQQAG